MPTKMLTSEIWSHDRGGKWGIFRKVLVWKSEVQKCITLIFLLFRTLRVAIWWTLDLIRLRRAGFKGLRCLTFISNFWLKSNYYVRVKSPKSVKTWFDCSNPRTDVNHRQTIVKLTFDQSKQELTNDFVEPRFNWRMHWSNLSLTGFCVI